MHTVSDGIKLQRGTVPAIHVAHDINGISPGRPLAVIPPLFILVKSEILVRICEIRQGCFSAREELLFFAFIVAHTKLNVSFKRF